MKEFMCSFCCSDCVTRSVITHVLCGGSGFIAEDAEVLASVQVLRVGLCGSGESNLSRTALCFELRLMPLFL